MEVGWLVLDQERVADRQPEKVESDSLLHAAFQKPLHIWIICC
jgi:hypothetical protein